MIETNAYQDWMARVEAGAKTRPNVSDEVVKLAPPTPFAPLEFYRTDRKMYVAEVAQRGDDYIYHFFLETEILHFEEKLAAAFLEVFKLEDRIQAAFAEELNSWAVKVIGYAGNPMADPLVIQVFDALDKRIS
jgi:hypothetical protein